MSRRKANLEVEFAQAREIKELKQEIAKLKKQLREQEKSAIVKEEPVAKKPAKKVAKECPNCGAEVKVTDLPHAVMELCSKGCGYRNVKGKK
jgi:ABC-type Zn uptake system ZnuABC Zn-binding protein ZnuA